MITGICPEHTSVPLLDFLDDLKFNTTRSSVVTLDCPEDTKEDKREIL